METNFGIETLRVATRRSARAWTVLGLGPVAMIAGVVWAVVQPYRLTILHPHGQGFWWLAVEPPLLVVLAGILFAMVVVPGLVEDIEEAEDDAAAR